MSTIVKLLRVLHKDTQQELANLVNCTNSTFNMKENGKKEFTLKEAELIAAKYGVSVDTLIKGEQMKIKILELLQE